MSVDEKHAATYQAASCSVEGVECARAPSQIIVTSMIYVVSE